MKTMSRLAVLLVLLADWAAFGTRTGRAHWIDEAIGLAFLFVFGLVFILVILIPRWIGRTLGMLATDGLAVFLGDRLAAKVQSARPLAANHRGLLVLRLRNRVGVESAALASP